jgi:hypothetical protein
MNPEFPAIDPDKMVSPHAQEVEFALILSRMINSVKDDPVQMRLAIYEFARARLKIDSSVAEKAERQRLAAALETAIQGVEQFSARREEKELLLQPPAPQIPFDNSPAEPPSTSMVSIYQINPAPKGTLVPKEIYQYSQSDAETLMRLPIPRAWFWIGALLVGLVAGEAGYNQRESLLRWAGAKAPPSTVVMVAKPPASTAHPPEQGPPQVDEVKTATVSPASSPFPLPSDYGVYALNNAALSELSVLPEQVPDKRIAMSTPINQSSRTTLADGKAKFVLFRRDLAGNAPERVDVRVVARVVRALTFDAKGKASFSPVSDVWNIRNISYEFRVRPLPGNPEMLLVQPATPDFVLPAGRYVLALKNQGYDFTVPGKVTDPSQCLERTDAANGEFYSDCQK